MNIVENSMAEILMICAMEKEGMYIANKLGLKKIDEKIYRDREISLLITGIGKQKTAINFMEYLLKNNYPSIAINIGYAGSTDIQIGSWVNIVKSYNYEWNIPGEERYNMLDFGNQELIKMENRDIQKVDCYSSESFVTDTDLTGHIAFDMELHSIALICDMKKIPLLSMKKISDHLNIDNYYENIEQDKVMELESVVELLRKENII